MFVRRVLCQSRHIDDESAATAAPRQRDERQAASILAAAANMIKCSTDDVDGIAAALEKHGVRFAWQLARLTPEHYHRISGGGMSLGLETAIREVIANPPPQLAASAAEEFSTTASASASASEVELTPALRRFLLLPAADGTPAARLGAFSAVFYSTLLLPVAERQEILLVVCELVALVSGLFLALPLDMLSYRTTAGAAAKGWDVWPTYEDGMSTLSLAIFQSILTGTINCVMTAVFVALAGRTAGSVFYERIVASVVASTCLFFSGCWALIILVIWQVLTVSASPYVFICWALLGFPLLGAASAVMSRALFIAAPLEMYHLPRPFRACLAMMFPPLMKDEHGRKVHSEDVLREMAEARASVLRARIGLNRADNQCMPGSFNERWSFGHDTRKAF